MNRLIVIADIVASREIADRTAVQRDLKMELDRLNRQTDDLLSPYTITLGDEFQAVLGTAGRVFTDMLAIRAAVYPVRLR
ncbi:MAG: SatD family protein, partial [Saccharospirillum sp.]